MKEITYYLADDGKQFDNEYDCEMYELKCAMSNSTLMFYDEDENVIVDLHELDRADVIRIRTENDFKVFKDILWYFGGCCCWEDITGIGNWQFGFVIPKDVTNPYSYEEHFHNTLEDKYEVRPLYHHPWRKNTRQLIPK